MNPPAHSGRDTPAQDAPPTRPPQRQDKDQTPPRPSERSIDEALEETFPASDPPATGVTRIDPSPPAGTDDPGRSSPRRRTAPPAAGRARAQPGGSS